MIARSVLATNVLAFNAVTGAPFHGAFGMYRPWRTTRVFEFGWAATVIEVKPGWRAVDVGGAMTGLAGVMAARGVETCVVDPDPSGNSPAALARAHLGVPFHRCRIEDSPIPVGSLDIAWCLSVIEHIPTEAERGALMRGVYERLRPGGWFVLTVDLFLGLAPFTATISSGNNRNVDVSELLAASPFERRLGEPTELYGCPGFCTASIEARAVAGELLVGAGRLLTQCLVLRRPG